MHIKVHIEASEQEYAYGDGDEPKGEQNIDLEMSEELAGLVDLRDLLQTAVGLSVRDYRKATAAETKEHVAEEVLQ